MEKRSPGRPNDKHSTDLDMIMRSSIKEFARQGYGGVTINSLAKKVGIADSLFHYHFGSKLNLWKSCMTLIGEEITLKFENLSKLSSDINGLDRLKLFNKQLVYVSAEYPEFQQIVVQEVFSESERSIWLISELLRPIYAYFSEILESEQEKGNMKKIPAANLTSFIIGSITTLFSRSFQMKKLYGIDAFSPEEIEKHAEVMNELIIGALKI
ncbi:TetR/AcrR family transcriptional regulator [Portibacter lacus]|uniref:HTH tetR-type domain-containing protein n=1 Tax=Portibacter lacus TaxID=1099794 RepID=A0AA37SMV8_9BACT|nr:TetR/AcrR family transcriptional regulator [Portibacter lacus]GLR15801.1 hypothetical protein GCM10007940_04160 [Portibacter lacus]